MGQRISSAIIKRAGGSNGAVGLSPKLTEASVSPLRAVPPTLPETLPPVEDTQVQQDEVFMSSELLNILNKLGPIEKMEQTRLPTSPLSGDVDLSGDQGAHVIRHERLEAGVVDSEEAKRTLPMARHAIREDALEEDWREAVAAPGSGRLTEVQVLELFEHIRDDANESSSSSSLALKFGLDEETLTVLRAFCASPHVSEDSKTGESFGTWAPRVVRPE